MKKLYLFIFLIVIVSSQSLAVKAVTKLNVSAKKRVLTAQTITFGAIPGQTWGPGGTVSVTATASSGLTVSLASSNTAIATVASAGGNNFTITFVATGTVNITASQAGNTTYAAATPVVQPLTIAKLTPVITLAATNSTPMGVADFSPATSNNPATAITYVSSNLNVATVISNKVHLIGVGQTTITASQASDANDNAASNTPAQTLTVTTGTPVITFAQPAAATFGAADITPAGTLTNASGYSWGTVPIYTSSNTSVASIVAGKFHLIGPGTTTITASAPADANFNAGTPVSQTLTVNAATTQAVISAFSNTTVPLQSADLAFTATSTYSPATYVNNPIIYTITASSAPGIATIVNNRLHMLAAGGTVTIQATQPGNGKFPDAAPVSAVYTIAAPNPLTFTTSLTGKAVGSADLDPAAAYPGTGAWYSTITYSLSPANAAVSIVSNRLHFISPLAANTVTVNASISYPTAGGGTATLTTANTTLSIVAAASATLAITFTNPGTLALSNNDYVPTVSSTVGSVPVVLTSSNTAVATIVNGNIHMVSKGTSVITATQQNTPAGAAAAAATATLPADVQYTVTVGAPTLSFTTGAIATKVGADVPFSSLAVKASLSNIGYTVTSSNPSVLSVISGASGGGVIHYTGLAGSATITVSQGGGASGNTTSNPPLPPDATSTYTIATPVTTFAAIGTKQFSSSNYSLSYTLGNTTAPFTITSSNPSVAAIASNGTSVQFISAPPAPNNTTTITISQGGGASGTPFLPADISQILTVTPPTISWPTIGTKSPTPDFNPGATSTNGNILMYYTSSNPAVATINNTLSLTGLVGGSGYANNAVGTTVYTNVPLIGGTGATSITKFSSTVGGTGYTNGTYYSVPLTGGTGSGATATITVSGGSVTSVALVAPGTGYTLGDVLSATAANLGGTGSGFSATAATGTLANITVVNGAVNTVTLATSGTGYTNGDFLTCNPSLIGGTNTGAITSFPTIVNAGAGYLSGTYYSVPLTGGAGTGATATITVAGGLVSTITLITPGTGYNFGDVLSVAPAALGGTFTSGSGYTNGIYYNVPLTGGTGTGALATITVSNGIVTAATITAGGAVYSAGDVLSASSSIIGSSGSGFSIKVATAGALSIGNVFTVFYVKALTGFSETVNGYTSLVHFSPNIPAAPNNTTVITASQGGGVNGTLTQAPDVSQVMTVPSPAITFPALGTKQLTSVDLNPGATGIYTTGNSIATVGTLVAGSGYTPGTYYNVPLTGGTGTGATATIVVTGSSAITTSSVGTVTSVTITNPGVFYTAGNVLTTANTNIGGTGTGFTINVATVSSGYPVIYTSSNPAVATIVNNMIHFVSAPAAPNNTTVITATQTGPPGGNTGNLSLPPSVSQTLTVTPASITFGALGTKVFTNTDLNPGATSTLSNIPVNYTSSNTAVAIINNQSVSGTNNFVRGSGYTSGTYYNVPLTGGTGTGATAQIITGPVTAIFNPVTNVVSYINGIQSAVILTGGSGYTVGDVLSCNPSSVGGTGTGFSLTVSSISSLIHFVGTGTTNIVATQQNTPAGSPLAAATPTLPADVQQTLTVTAPLISFPAIANVTLPSSDVNPAATTTYLGVPITYSSSNTAVATIKANSIQSVATGYIGNGYATGTYTNVPLIYYSGTGTGSGALATITVSGGQVGTIVITDGGIGYNVGDLLTTAAVNLGGTSTSGIGFSVQVLSVGGMIHMIGAGTATITATQGGSTNPNAPADQTQTLTVLPYSLGLPPLGGVTLSDVPINPGANTTLTTVPITYTSSNTSVATILPNSVTSFSTVVAGNGYPSGTYYNVPLAYYGGATGTGSGILANITVSNGGVASATITYGGSNYVVGDNLVIPVAAIGGSGSGAILVVGGVSGVVHLVSGPVGPTYAPVTVTIKASQQGSSATTNATATPGLPADVSQTLTIYSPAISFAGIPLTNNAGTLGTKTFSNIDYNPQVSSTLSRTPIALTSSNTNVATIINNEITALNSPIGGLGYIAGTYTNVPLTGGSGSGATANIVTANGAVVSATLVLAGSGYQPGDILSAATSNLGGVGINFTVSVNTVASLIHYVAAGTTTITATQQGTLPGAPAAAATSTLPADVQVTLTVVAPKITFPAATATVNYTNVDAIPGASSPYTLTPITYSYTYLGVNSLTGTPSANSPATIVNDLVLNTPIAGGAGYTPGTYTAVPLLGGSGTGAVANITVSSVGLVTKVIITNNGTGYLPGDVLTASAANLASVGTGTGFSATVTGYVSLIHYNPTIQAAPNNVVTITASQGGGATGNGIIPADASETLTVLAPQITFPTLGTAGVVPFSNSDVILGATSTVANVPITYSLVTTPVTGVAYITPGNELRLVGPGTATITASQGNPTGLLPGLPANVSQNITITGTPALTVTTALGSQKLATAPINLSNYFSSNYTVVPITYTLTSVTPAGSATLNNGFLQMVSTPTSTSATVTVTASQATTQPNQPVIAPVSSTLTILSPAITFPTITAPKIQSADLPPGATSTITGVPVTYTSSNSAIATIVNGNIHFTGGLGAVTIVATQQGTLAGATLAAATTTLPADVSQTITVSAPAITFAALGSKNFTVLDFNPTVSSTLSTIPVTLTTSDPNVATIVNGNIHYVGLGTCTITATQAAAAVAVGYAPPVDVQQTLTVIAPTLTLSALGTKTFSSTDIVASTITTSSLNNTAPITYTSSDPTVATIVTSATDVSAIHFVGVGTTVITATQASYLGSGTPLSATSVLTVTSAVITGSAAQTKPLIGTADAAVSGYSSTLSTTTYPITYTSSNPLVATIIGGTTLHIVGLGTSVITGYQTISSNYAPAPVSFVLTVNNPAPTTPVLNLSPLGTLPYSNQADIAPVTSGSNANYPIIFTSSNPAVATIVNNNIHLTPPTVVNGVVTYPNPNTTVITASQGGGPFGVAGLLPADVSQVLTVVPASISFPSLGTKAFSTVDLPPNAVCSYSVLNANNVAQPITYTSSDPTVVTIVNGNIHYVGLGSVTITASVGGVIAPDVTSNLVVTAPVITFPALGSKVYSSSGILPGATSTLTTVPITYTSSNPSVATIVNGTIVFTGLGTTTITASQAAVGNSSTPISVDQLMTVTAPTLAFASGSTRTQQFTLTDQDLLNSSAGFGASSTVLTVPITYTSSNPALVTIINNSKLHFVVPPSSGITDNVAVITATQAGANGIPTLVATQVLTVSQNVIMPVALTKYYGDADFVPGYSIFGPNYPVTYTSGTTGTATVTSSIIANGTIHIVAPGTSTITALQAGDANTAAVSSGATTALTVLPAPMTITPKNVTITYGTTVVPILPLSYQGFKSSTGGVPLDDSTKFSTQPTVNVLGQSLNGNFSKLPVGTYTLTATGAVAGSYTFTYGTGTLTVVAATQNLTWVNAGKKISKTFNTPDFDPLARSTGDPVVYTSSNPAAATIVNGKVHIVSAGAGYTIIAATLNQTSGNFVNPTPGVPLVLTDTLVITRASQTISVSAIPTLLRGGADYTPTATASSGLPITSIIAVDSSLVTPVGLNLHAAHVGTTYVRFIQAGDGMNWLPDTSAAVPVIVVDPSGLPVTVHQAVSPNGDGVNDFLYIEGIQGYTPNHVKIINRNGDNVYEADNYNNTTVAFTAKARNGDYLPAGTYFYIVDYYIGNVKNHTTGYFVIKY